MTIYSTRTLRKKRDCTVNGCKARDCWYRYGKPIDWCFNTVDKHWIVPRNARSVTLCVSNEAVAGAIKARAREDVREKFLLAPFYVWWWVEYQ